MVFLSSYYLLLRASTISPKATYRIVKDKRESIVDVTIVVSIILYPFELKEGEAPSFGYLDLIEPNIHFAPTASSTSPKTDAITVAFDV